MKLEHCIQSYCKTNVVNNLKIKLNFIFVLQTVLGKDYTHSFTFLIEMFVNIFTHCHHSLLNNHMVYSNCI